MGDEAQKIADFMNHVAEDKEVQIFVHGRSLVLADRLPVQRAVTNLLSNAIRHADDKSVIAIHVIDTVKDKIRLVRNQGDPITLVDGNGYLTASTE